MSVFSHAKYQNAGLPADAIGVIPEAGEAVEARTADNVAASHATPAPKRSHTGKISGAERALPGEVPAVTYPDASSLERPTRHKALHYIPIIICVLLAAGVSGFVGWRAYDALVVEPERELDRTIDCLEASVNYQLPALLGLIDLTDAEMDATVRAGGSSVVTLAEYAANPEESEGFDLYRIPATLTEKQGAAFLDTGIAQLKRSQAALFLNGSWRYTVYRYLSCAVRLQYADFTATTAAAAIAHAMQAQGWLTQEALDALTANFALGTSAGAGTGTASGAGAGVGGEGSTPEVAGAGTETPSGEAGLGEGEASSSPEAEGGEGEEVQTSLGENAETATDPTMSKWTLTPLEGLDTSEGQSFTAQEFAGEIIMGDFGLDGNGNTYQAGTIVVDERHYEFRISTVTVEDMYGLGLPRSGMFVGIRLTQIILE